jgi:HEAT repeat protein/NAD-dependent SIR2 family protein deacetylase
MTTAHPLRKKITSLIDSGETNQSKLAAAASLQRSQVSRFLSGLDLSDESLTKLQYAVDLIARKDAPLPDEVALKLARKLRDNQLVVLVGAGLSHLCLPVSPSGARLPLWKGLVEAVAKDFDEDGADAASFSDPTDFFDHVSAFDNGAARIKLALRKALDDQQVAPSGAHAALAALPWAEVWTTNYDGLLERALARPGVDGESEFSHLRELERKKTPYVLHLHGTLNNPHTLGKDSYRLWDDENPQILNRIRHTLGRCTVLFVGYSLNDPNLDAALTWLRKVQGDPALKSARGKSYSPTELFAWLWKATPAQIELRKNRDNITAVSLTEEDQHRLAFEQLRRAYAALISPPPGDPAKQAQPSTSADFPRAPVARSLRAYWADAGLARMYVLSARPAGEQVTIEDVFVEPDLLRLALQPRRDTDAARDSKNTSSPSPLSVEDLPPERPSLKDAQAARLRTQVNEAFEAEPSKEQREPGLAAVQTHGSLILLGEPGSGKSLLLRSAAREGLLRWCAPDAGADVPFPYYFRLNQWEISRERQEPADILLLALREALTASTHATTEDAQRLVAATLPIHWLLDGLDEVRNPAERVRVQEAVQALKRLRPQDRFTISLRPSGNTVPWGSAWETRSLAPLSDLQVKAVLGKWTHIFEKLDGRGLSAAAIDSGLTKNPALTQLRRNPLLLGLAAFFCRSHNRLPHDRWEYYENADQNLRIQLRQDVLNRDQNVANLTTEWNVLLGRIALEGMRNGQVRFTRAQLQDTVFKYYAKERGCSYAETSTHVEAFPRAAEDLIGVIVAFAPDAFGFLHLTFQEYHAAQALLARDEASRKVVIAQEWDNPDWVELWALYLLGAKAKGLSAAIEALFQGALDNPHATLDAQLHRPYHAVLHWAGQTGTHAPNSPAWKHVEAWTIGRLSGSHPALQITLRTLTHPAFSHATLISRALLGLALHEDVLVRRGAADALRALVAEPEGSQALLRLLADEDSIVRYAAAEALRAVANQPEVSHALLGLLADEEMLVRGSAVETLRGVANQLEVTHALLRLVADKNSDVRSGVAQALRADVAQPDVTQALLRLVADENSNVRYCAARALRPVANQPEVTQALLRLIVDEDSDVRGSVAQALSAAVTRPGVTQALMHALADESSFVRHNVTRALRTVVTQSEITEALLRLAEDVDSGVRLGAADALRVIADQPKVTQALLRLCTDENSNVRYSATLALRAVATQPKVTHALLRLVADGNSDVRRNVTEALSAVANQPEVTQVLLRLVGDPDSSVRVSVTRDLSTVAARPEITHALLHLLSDDAWNVRYCAAQALSATATQPAVTDALLCLLADDSSEVRTSAVRALSAAATQPEVTQGLIRLISDKSLDVRLSATNTLGAVARAQRVSVFAPLQR